MKQLIQSFKTGETSIIDVPVPNPGKGDVLIRTTHSLVSLGTEKMLVQFGKANLIDKARQQPDKVKQVISKIKTDGLLPTVENVFKRLEEPLPLGYCNSGIVVATGPNVNSVKVGDRVASNGKHAEYVCVPENLVAKVPDNVRSEEAAFTVIASIGLQGIRLCNPTFGETIVVFGLGLIGLITAQLLKANGCRVIGIDIDKQKCKIAESFGIETINVSQSTNTVQKVLELTDENGADGIIITASSKDNSIISQAANMSRKRGRIILVGVIGLDINRADFYEKELSFQVSCSYGPGRYEDIYEKKGMDYPLQFVRWTENRNFYAVLQAIAGKQLNVLDLITEKVKFENYLSVYGNIGTSKSVASILEYPLTEENPPAIERMIKLQEVQASPQAAVIGLIGAGNFTKMTLLPALKNTGASLRNIASSTGLSGTVLAKKFGFEYSTSDYREILNDATISTVVISTRHNTHASLTVEALKAGKHVFVEKPLALSTDELRKIEETYKDIADSNLTLTVGFNRRFSPHIQAIKKEIGEQPGPVNIVATMNAGFIPANSWVHDIETGGGRIIGEACHYIDLCVYLSGSEIQSVCMQSMGTDSKENTDNASILLKFKNGSNAVVNYFANGSKSYSKERIELFSQGRVFIMDNFRQTSAYGVKGFKKLKTRMDKGHKNQFNLYVKMIRDGQSPIIPYSEIINTSRASIAAIQSMKENRWMEIPTSSE